MKVLARRAVIFVVLLQASYLVLANLALNVPLTSDLVNKIRPDKFKVDWESGWTWYPGQVNVKGVDASGRARKHGWRVAVSRASGRVSLLPLIARNVRVNHVEATDVTFSFQPHPGAEPDNATRVPNVEDRAADSQPGAGAAGNGQKRPWDVRIGDIQVSGSHNVKLNRVQAALSGTLDGSFSVQAPRGPLSLSDGDFDVNVDSVVQDGEHVVLQQARIRGKLQILPVDPGEHRGIELLDFLVVHASIDATTDSLTLLNPYLEFFQGMRVDGGGVVKGDAILDQGVLQPGTDLAVSASKLDLRVIDMEIEGEGEMTISVPQAGDKTEIGVTFGELDVYSQEHRIALLEGTGLEIYAVGPTRVVPDTQSLLPSSRLSIEIPSLRVPNVSAYQQFLPASWAFTLHGGEGELQGSAKLTDDAFDASIGLVSQQADIGFRQFRFSSDLDVRVVVDSASLEHGLVDVSGTYFHLSDGRLSNEDEGSDPWSAAINLEKGLVRLNLEEAEEGVAGARHLVTKLKDTEFGTLIGAADEELAISGTVSDLRWLNLLFENDLGLAIRGSGAVNGDVTVLSGQVGEGTRLVVEPDTLSVDVLDYRAAGDGEVELSVVKGGEHPDVSLIVGIDDSRFGRLDSEEAFIEDVDISLEALVRSLELGDDSPDFELSLRIPSAKISDMSVYNQYFPDSSPLEIVSGKADLEVDVQLRPEDAGGFIRLVTSDLRSRIDDQEISGDLDAHITLTGGVPKDREFDVSGSALVLDGVRVIGDEESFRDEDWSANIDLTTARVVWKAPIHLDVEADISMTDSMPMVSILANERGKHGWLEKAMTVDDVSGTAKVQIDDQYIVIPSAFVSSDKIDVGAKGVIREDSRSGMIYVRFGVLKALLESKDGKRNLDVINTKKQFDAYSTEEVLRTMSRN